MYFVEIWTETVFHSEVQICVYDQMNRIQEGQYIARDQWIHWDAESIAQIAAQEIQFLDSESNYSDSTLLYNLDSDMASQNNIQTESVDSTVDIDLSDIKELRAKLSLLGGSDSPPPDFVMPTTIHHPFLYIHQHPLHTVPGTVP